MSVPPIERPEGQEDEPPNLMLALVVTSALLNDLGDRLRRDHNNGDGDAAGLLLRVSALLSVLRRLRKAIEDGDLP